MVERFGQNFPNIPEQGGGSVESISRWLQNVVRSLNDFRHEVAIISDDHADRLIVQEDAGVPSTIPSRIGEIYLDTTNNNLYMAKGTASSADWLRINNP